MPGNYPQQPPSYAAPYATAAGPAPTGLRKWSIILMWVTVAATVLSAFAAFNRKNVWDDFVTGSKTIADVDDADGFIATTMLLYFAAALATAIVLAVWSNKVANNAKARGADVSPGLAAGGWFIPIGWYFVPFMQLRKAAAGRADTSSIGWWQGLFAVAMITGGVALQMFDADDSSQSSSDVSDGLRNQSIGLAIAAVVFVGATVFATRAMRSIEAATSGA